MGKNNKKNGWKENRPLMFFLLASAIFLFVINRWFWPTPDEYLYASVARSIVAGVKGDICLSCFNTEHTYLVSAIIALYQWIFNILTYDLVGNRVPIIFFSLGTIVLIWLIAGQVVKNKKEQSWFLWLLLLIPGYFVFSARFLLDVPLTFGFALLLYLLITRARAIWVGLALALILLIKDYGFYLAAPLVIIGFIFDVPEVWQSNKLRNLANFIIKLLTAFLPSFFAIVVLLVFNFLPYPRLLETGLIEYFGDGYVMFIKIIAWLLEKIGPLINPSDGYSYAHIIARKADQIEFAGKFPMAIFDSPLVPEATGGFFKKLWLIYQYNFSEQDVMIFTLPLFFTGLILRIKMIVKSGKSWFLKRADILFLIFTLIFFYLNWHEALNVHGFRLTTPITVALVYFSYWGLKAILMKNNHWARMIFAFSSIIFLGLYAAFILQIEGYGSVISGQPIASWLLHYKLPIFLALFLTGFLFLGFYPILSWRRRKLLLLAGLIFFFTLKFFPFYLEARVAIKQYGFDYGLPEAARTLEELKTKNITVATNINAYTTDYYANLLNLPNEGSFPAIRTLGGQSNPIIFTRFFEKTEVNLSQLVESNIGYIFYLNKTIYDIPDTIIYKSIITNHTHFKLIEEKLNGKRIQWQLFRVNF